MSTRRNVTALFVFAAAIAATMGAYLTHAPSGHAAAHAGAANSPGAVYAMTNERLANRIFVYDRRSDGTLAAPRPFDTGGQGSGLIDQSANSLIRAGGNGESSQQNITGSSEYLFTVNTGSNSVSSFRLKGGGDPVLADVATGLDHPISLTYSKHRLFVLNAQTQSCQGGIPSITGFDVAGDGTLTPIPGSTRIVPGGPESGCTMIAFNPRGDVLVISEKLADLLITYPVSKDGIPAAPIVNNTTGVDPFGFGFTHQGQLITSENYNSMGGAASTYDVPDSGVLVPISPSVLSGRMDSCWIAISNNEKYFYVSNAVSGDVSSYTLDNDGNIALLQSVAGSVGPMAFDEAMSGNGRYLYVRSVTLGTIVVFEVQNDGSLVQIQSVGGLPPGSAEGLAAR